MKKLIALSLIALALLAAAYASEAALGAKAAALDPEPSIAEMLRYAIEDEYLARGEYELIMRKFGSMRPFSNIMKAEESHIVWLRDAYAAAALAPPRDESASQVIAPATLKESFQAGIQAEIGNIAMYDSFLASGLLGRPENAALKELFTRLREASKNHLAAFQNALGRY
ncbi:MAG TPA: hypothetical protein PLB91_02625 [Spirochaetales bacterium]|nr:hypothetical protein [Spirochaetales bacterium]HRY54625.1 hypothetical protein [Spirochaetia bacterium]HRZ64432.1 hypothetical protein [Spirochaetia bacterium]